MDVTLLPALEQARLIAARELSGRELLEAIADRYERLHPTINAVVVERLDDARVAASVADAAVVSGDELGPFHGVPITVKDVIDWVGTPSTWGDPHHAGYFPAHNAVALDRLLGLGVIVWGKTNVPKDLAEWQTFNAIHGRTNNPYALDRTPGGSSGGSAAALAVGYAGLELGSDIGGSLRIPAHYCGVVGHKPSFGAVPQTGHAYPGHDAPVDINVVGPMARSASDLEVVMPVLSDLRLRAVQRTSLHEFSVGVLLHNPCGGEQDNEMTSVIQAAIERLERAGLRIDSRPLPVDLERVQRNYLMLNYAATALVDRSDRPNIDNRNAAALSHSVWLQLANERQRIRDRWQRYFADVDVLLCPATAGVASPHQTGVAFVDQTLPVNGHMVSNQDQWLWAGMASGAYLPATVAPVGRVASGLPVGVQVIGPFLGDLMTLKVASLIERELGGFSPPGLVAPAVTGSTAEDATGR